jgi:hypothetical protein
MIQSNLNREQSNVFSDAQTRDWPVPQYFSPRMGATVPKLWLGLIVRVRLTMWFWRGFASCAVRVSSLSTGLAVRGSIASPVSLSAGGLCCRSIGLAG